MELAHIRHPPRDQTTVSESDVFGDLQARDVQQQQKKTENEEQRKVTNDLVEEDKNSHICLPTPSTSTAPQSESDSHSTDLQITSTKIDNDDHIEHESPRDKPQPPSRLLKPKLSVHNSDEMRDILASLRAEIESINSVSQTPPAAHHTHVNVDNECKQWLLERAVEGGSGCEEEVERWIRDRFDCHDNDLVLRTVINTPLDREDNTMAHKAASHNHTQLLMWLIENQADLMMKNNVEATVLHCAASNGCTAALELLLSVTLPSMMEDRDYYGHTPLHLATKNHHTEVVETLIRANANLKSKTRGQKGMTALHLACVHGYDDLVEIMLHEDPSLFSMKVLYIYICVCN